MIRSEENIQVEERKLAEIKEGNEEEAPVSHGALAHVTLGGSPVCPQESTRLDAKETGQ